MFAIYQINNKPAQVKQYSLKDQNGYFFRNDMNESYYIKNENIIAYGTMHKLKTNYPEYFI